MKEELQSGLKNVKDAVGKVITSEETKNAVKAVVDSTETVILSAKETASSVAKKLKTKDIKSTVYIQHGGRETEFSSLHEKIVQDYIAQGNDAGDVKDIKVYLKPAENKVYYVVNDATTGQISLFE